METRYILRISLPDTVYQAASEVASQQGVSLEHLALEAITARAQRPTEMDLQA